MRQDDEISDTANGPSDQRTLVAVGMSLVAVGAAGGIAQPALGLPVLLVGILVLMVSLLRASREDDGRAADARVQDGLGLVCLLAGMMLAGGGAAFSALQDAVTGLGIALAGGTLCGVGAWWLLRNRG